MEILKSWSICLCVVTFFNLIISHLLPEGATAQTVKGITAMLLLLAVINPIAEAADALREISIVEESTIQNADNEEVQLIAKQMVEQKITEDISNLLQKNGVREFKINVQTDILSDNSIDIKQIDVIVYQLTLNREELEMILKEYCVACELIVSEQDNHENK